MGADPEIQQALHGYSEGHRKLASSCRLPKDAERQVLILSDLSGPGGGDQFDPYLTGYPVESADLYALARTWPAPEMGRPGCVWTHTLLIAMDLLSDLDRPEALLGLFRRPSREEGFDGYHESLSLRVDAAPALDRDPMLGSGLIQALYGRASPYTVLPVPRYSAAEAPFLSVWRLQWASLRRHFTFCTGVRHRRSLEGEAFHLQAALPRDVRRLDRGSAPPTVVEPGSSEEAQEEWVRVAVEAYSDLDDSLLHFFRRMGSELPGRTTLFRPVVETFSIVRRPAGDVIDELIRYAANEYPLPEDGQDYKLAFFGENVVKLSETQLIKGLCFSDRYASFTPELLQLRARCVRLWADEEQAWNLLVDLLGGALNPLGEEAVEALTSAMPAAQLQKAVWSRPEVLTGIIRREPRLATSEHLWASPERQSFAAEAMNACREQLADLADSIIHAALESGADPARPSLIDVFGATAVASTLTWIDQGPPREVPTGWRAAMAGRPSEMLDWLRTHPSARRETTFFVLTTINLESAIGNPLLVGALKDYLAAPPDDAAVTVASRFLQASLHDWSPNAVDLASIVLDIVYRAAADARLRDGLWHELVPYLPVASWWQDWDRCERLRRGVAEKFRSQQWPASKLTGITRDDRLFAELIGELRERRSGRRVIAAAAESETAGARRQLMVGD